jgi:hypothetical protein
MTMKKNNPRFLLIFFIFAALGFSGCQNEQLTPTVDPSGTKCTANEAEIGVGDGFIENICGCTGAGELTKGVQTAPANTTCTVPSGTTVMFVYIAIQNEHQIVNSGGLFFPSNVLATPSDASTHISGSLFSASGTYLFQDAFDTAIQGKIIVP